MSEQTPSVAAPMGRLSGLHDRIAADVAPLGGFLQCLTCGSAWWLVEREISTNLAHGWPKCCGYTMRWWTQRQIDAGEVEVPAHLAQNPPEVTP